MRVKQQLEKSRTSSKASMAKQGSLDHLKLVDQDRNTTNAYDGGAMACAENLPRVARGHRRSEISSRRVSEPQSQLEIVS